MMKRFVIYICLFVVLISFGVLNGKVLAVNEHFQILNSVLFSGTDAVCSTSTALNSASTDNKSISYNFLIQKGLTNLQAAAIVGNLQQESGVGIEPKALNSSSKAYGIAQWLSGRKANLLKKPGFDTLTVQLEYIWEELNGSEKSSLSALKGSSSTDVRVLAVLFGEKYERYGKGEEGRRAEYAEAIFAQFGGSVPTTGTGGNCTNIGAGNFVYYSQKDPKWGGEKYGTSTIEPSGCGPTSLAMIVATLSDKSITPKEVAVLGNENDSYIVGVGTSHAKLLKPASIKWGFKYSDISNQDIDNVIDVIKSGGLVYMGGKGPAPFTDGGHVIVIRGMTSDGKFIVGDPYRGPIDTYTKNEIDAYRGTTYGITKS